MHILWFELATLALAVVSGGFFFREQLAERPLLEKAVGVIVIVGLLQFVFGALGSAYTWSQRVAESYQKEAQLVRENAAREAEEATNKEFQSELTRLGCYRGGIDGVWGHQSKSALSDFLEAIGKGDEYGESVQVSDARAMFAEAPNGVCTQAKRSATLRRYRTAHNDFLDRCVGHFLFIPFDKSSPECAELKNQRDDAARTLKGLGIAVPS